MESRMFSGYGVVTLYPLNITLARGNFEESDNLTISHVDAKMSHQP